MLKTERLVAITLLLQARGKMTAERLATILDVSPRTIYRDMDTLSLAHVPVSMDYGPGGGYYLPDDYRLDPAIFTSDEAVALALGGVVAGGYRLFENDDGLRRALVKLEAALPDEYRAGVRAARERILFDTTAWYRQASPLPHHPHLETVRAAVWTARQLELLYPHANGPEGTQWRRVEPHGLVCKAGIWYLVAYCHLRRDFRTFRVDRVEDLRVRDEAVTPRPGFDLQTFWEESRRRFEEQTRVVLTLEVSPGLLRRLRGACRVVHEGGEGETSTVQMDAESREAAVASTLALGPEVVVLDPPDLRQAVATAARAMALLYA